MTTTPLRGPRRFARPAFALVAAAFAAAVTVQIFIAGLAVFVSPVNWITHSSFAVILAPFPLLMLLLAFVGRLPRGMQWQSAALLVPMPFLFLTADIIGDWPWLAATHPVIAVVLFWASVRIATMGWRFAFETNLKSDLKQEKQIVSVNIVAGETES